jgi:D-lactate dehydrogenase
MDYTVYFYEAFDEEERELKKYLPAEINAGFTWKTIQEAGHKNPPAEIISTRTQSIYPQSWAPEIKAIISRSTGYDHLEDYRQKTQAVFALGYLPLYCSRTVAEQALMFWMALMRKLSRQQWQFKTFYRDGLTGREVQHKNLVVYGVGNIGYEVIKIGRGLDMNVTGVDIIKKHSDVSYTKPLEGAAQADIIVCAMNLTTQNENYFNQNFFKHVKPSLIFVNVSRGEISPVTGILEALEKGKISGAALDVFDHEKNLAVGLRSGSFSSDKQVKTIQKMLEMDNVILTPHNAFNTMEAVERKSEQTVEQLIHFLQEGKLKWQV